MDGAVVASRGGGKEGEERAAFTIEGVEQERHNAGVRCGAAGRLGSFHTVRPHRVRPRPYREFIVFNRLRVSPHGVAVCGRGARTTVERLASLLPEGRGALRGAGDDPFGTPVATHDALSRGGYGAGAAGGGAVGHDAAMTMGRAQREREMLTWELKPNIKL